MNQTLHKLKVLACGALLVMQPGLAASEEDGLLNFKFSHISNMNNGQAALQENRVYSDFESEKNLLAVQFKQYDATLTYPINSADQSSGMNIDVGLTLRHLSGYRNSIEQSGSTYFQETLPLFHASAFYNFSFKGLTAGVESTHLSYKEKQFLDYKAKVSYEWRKGFGLQGGWQHQQFRLDSLEQNSASFTQDGPFIDFYLNF